MTVATLVKLNEYFVADAILLLSVSLQNDVHGLQIALINTVNVIA